jgi:hypothetical protein
MDLVTRRARRSESKRTSPREGHMQTTSHARRLRRAALVLVFVLLGS